jgi:ribosome recycling factor
VKERMRRVSIRNARRDANDELRKMQKEGLPEDVAKRLNRIFRNLPIIIQKD